MINRESLNDICSPSVDVEQVTKFKTVFYAVRYICLTAQLKKK